MASGSLTTIFSSSSRLRNLRMRPLIYFTYQFFQRPNQFNTILRGGRLFQQCVVDQFCEVEFERLQHLRQNQGSLRTADYTSLCEQLRDPRKTENKVDAVGADRLFILPPTYAGCNRYMLQNIQDIILISKKFGYPDFFSTMTCKPQ